MNSITITVFLKETSIAVALNSWADLLKDAGMDDNYFNKMKVSCLTEIKGHTWWPGIGNTLDQ